MLTRKLVRVVAAIAKNDDFREIDKSFQIISVPRIVPRSSVKNKMMIPKGLGLPMFIPVKPIMMQRVNITTPTT